MNSKLDQTQRILRSSKVTTDDRGRTVWADPVETAKLELMSTQMLRKVIDAGDAEQAARLQEVASCDSGLIARDVNDGRFEVINDEELQHILDGTEAEYEAKHAKAAAETAEVVVDVDEEFELVSTQMLRVILGDQLDTDDSVKEEGSFDPYDSN